jgi:lysophospholipase
MMCRLPSVLLIGWLALAEQVSAIPEEGYAKRYGQSVLPFLATGQRFAFRSADGVTPLQGIRFPSPGSNGVVVVLNGSTESWLKYGELFYDLQAKGYGIFSYDQRGQGLSPHLVKQDPQIGQIEDFGLYAADLEVFLRDVVLPTHPSRLFLIAHSMGGAVAIDYLQHHHRSPFRAAVLSAPMIRINTSPYPEPLARLVVKLLQAMGLGARYAPGKHDRDPGEPFELSRITSSRERWNAIARVWDSHPEAVLGGPSNDWVARALEETTLIRTHPGQVDLPVLVLEAGRDAFVRNPPDDELRRMLPGARIVRFPESRHELLFERDGIRDRAIREILRFFVN